ncbi:MAG: hypothetical protein NZM42_07370 [Gemmatales bacterium]|nr:hypothetical protein [Gemmatales bacterium]MDW8221725.1 hypothetical protein [Gemmatales bacterium]
MNRWETLVQQIAEVLRTRRLGPLVFARWVWQSATPLAQLPPKLACLLELLSQWMQQPAETMTMVRSDDGRDVTLIVTLRPSATAVITHLANEPAHQTVPRENAWSPEYPRPVGLDLFLLGTQGAIHLDGTQADWPHQPLLVPDLPAGHPVRARVERLWQGNQ